MLTKHATKVLCVLGVACTRLEAYLIEPVLRIIRPKDRIMSVYLLTSCSATSQIMPATNNGACLVLQRLMFGRGCSRRAVTHPIPELPRILLDCVRLGRQLALDLTL